MERPRRGSTHASEPSNRPAQQQRSGSRNATQRRPATATATAALASSSSQPSSRSPSASSARGTSQQSQQGDALRAPGGGTTGAGDKQSKRREGGHTGDLLHQQQQKSGGGGSRRESVDTTASSAAAPPRSRIDELRRLNADLERELIKADASASRREERVAELRQRLDASHRSLDHLHDSISAVGEQTLLLAEAVEGGVVEGGDSLAATALGASGTMLGATGRSFGASASRVSLVGGSSSLALRPVRLLREEFHTAHATPTRSAAATSAATTSVSDDFVRALERHVPPPALAALLLPPPPQASNSTSAASPRSASVHSLAARYERLHGLLRTLREAATADARHASRVGGALSTLDAALTATEAEVLAPALCAPGEGLPVAVASPTGRPPIAPTSSRPSTPTTSSNAGNMPVNSHGPTPSSRLFQAHWSTLDGVQAAREAVLHGPVAAAAAALSAESEAHDVFVAEAEAEVEAAMAALQAPASDAATGDAEVAAVKETASDPSAGFGGAAAAAAAVFPYLLGLEAAPTLPSTTTTAIDPPPQLGASPSSLAASTLPPLPVTPMAYLTAECRRLAGLALRLPAAFERDVRQPLLKEKARLIKAAKEQRMQLMRSGVRPSQQAGAAVLDAIIAGRGGGARSARGPGRSLESTTTGGDLEGGESGNEEEPDVKEPPPPFVLSAAGVLLHSGSRHARPVALATPAEHRLQQRLADTIAAIDGLRRDIAAAEREQAKAAAPHHTPARGTRTGSAATSTSHGPSHHHSPAGGAPAAFGPTIGSSFVRDDAPASALTAESRRLYSDLLQAREAAAAEARARRDELHRLRDFRVALSEERVEWTAAQREMECLIRRVPPPQRPSHRHGAGSSPSSSPSRSPHHPHHAPAFTSNPLTRPY